MPDRPLKEIRISVALALREGKILLLERRDKNPLWDHKWEFPDGKIEIGESPEAALVRELREETGQEPASLEFLGTHTHDWSLPDQILRVHLHCFRCCLDSEDIRLEKRSAYSYAWIPPAEAFSYDCLEANAHLIRTYLLN